MFNWPFIITDYCFFVKSAGYCTMKKFFIQVFGIYITLYFSYKKTRFL